MTTYRVSELAQRVGLPPSTVRFYARAGLLPACRSESGYRLFDDRTVARAEVIGSGKRLGLPLEDIAELLEVWDDGLCRDVREHLRPMVRGRIADAERRAAEIDAFLGRLRAATLVLDGPAPPGRCGPGCGMVPEPPAAAQGASERVRAEREPEAIACTLDASGQADRVGQWQRLLAQARGRQSAEGGLTLRFPARLAGPVAELAAAEQECCPFFEFTLHLTAGESRLEVRAPEAAALLLADVFGGAPAR